MKHENPHLLTVVAVAVVAYVLTKVLHEAVGHGFACSLLGGTWQSFSICWNECDHSRLAPTSVVVIKAAGTVVNLVVGALLLAWSHWSAPRHGATHYALWLTAAINLLMGAGYLAVDPLFGFGDWTRVIELLGNSTTLRLTLVVAGWGLYAVVVLLLLRTLRPFLAQQPSPAATARTLCLLPYLVVGGGIITLAAMLNPLGWPYAASSAAATLGGTSALAWMHSCVKNTPPGTTVVVQRSWTWMGLGAVALVLAFAVLGPGVTLNP